MAVLIETSLGDLTIDLYAEDCPRASENFLKLCKVKYYNWCLFHNVQRNFILQTGDPTGTGKGGRSVYGMLKGDQYDFFKDEIKPSLKFVRRGLLAMASAGPNLNGSQFFITAGDRLDSLDGRYTIFGEVVDDGSSFETLDKINDAYCDEEGRPYVDIRIRHTIVLDDPFDDPPGLRVPSRSPSPTREMLESGRLREDEVLDDEKDLDPEELERRIAEKEAKAGAQILSMIGDLPDENIKPPENVLFVCKLNPITTDADLELIFSRFGNILSSEIIRDRKTGDSLGYGFIEFEKEEDAEEAYLKMDNVLIDDRRIHVDFSQSVAKLWRNTATKSILSGKEKFRIKSQQRQEKGYDYVFSDEDEPNGLEKREKKPKEERKEKVIEKSSDKHGEGSTRDKEPPRHRDRSRSRDRARDRERSHRDGHRRDDRDRDRRRSRSRSRDRDRRDRDRDRDRRR